MDKKTFFHKVSLMRASQREYFKTRSSAALASSKLLERQIDELVKLVLSKRPTLKGKPFRIAF